MSEKKFAEFEQIAKIKVIGIGGGGNNTVNQMVENGVQGAEFILANTDAQILNASVVEKRIILGKELTKGLGAGGLPEMGRQATLESEQEIRQALTGADLVFVATGLGGGTGTGGAPIVAKIAKDLGALVIGIVTLPFGFEGTRRNGNARTGYDDLVKYVDAMISISNDRLLKIVGNIPLKDSFKEADNILRQCVQTITDLISVPALINLDFSDINSVLRNKGKCLIGIGIGKGENKAEEAANRAINSPLLETSLKGARHAIVNVTGGMSMTLNDVNKVTEILNQESGADGEGMDIKIGAAINDKLDDEMIITIIASGYVKEDQEKMHQKEMQIGNSLDYNEQMKRLKQAKEEVKGVDVNKTDSNTSRLIQIAKTLSNIDVRQLEAAQSRSHQNNDNEDLNDDDLPSFLKRRA